MDEDLESGLLRWKSTIESGSCGRDNDDLEWAYKKIEKVSSAYYGEHYKYLIMITGDGYMQDYEPSEDKYGLPSTTAPWQAESIRNDRILDAIFWGDTGDGLGSSNRMDSIGKYAFAHMWGPHNIVMTDNNDDEGDASIEFIDDYAFYDSSFDCFMSAESSYDVINLPYLSRIGNYAFYDCGFSTMDWTIAPNLTDLGKYAFAGCENLCRITLPDSLTEIKEGTFKDDRVLVTVNLPSKLQKIGSFAFENCSGIITITIPESVTYIGDGAFKNCSSLESIVITGPVELGNNVFEGCTNLKSVVINASADILTLSQIVTLYHSTIND